MLVLDRLQRPDVSTAERFLQFPGLVNTRRREGGGKGSLGNIDSPVDAGDVAVAVVRKVSGIDVFKDAYGRDPSSSNVHLNQRSVVHVRRRPRKPRQGCLLLVHAVHLHVQVPLRREEGLAFVGLEVVTALADQVQMLGFFSLGLAPLLVAPRLVDLPLDVVAPE